ncbi:hypothetical protein JTB14_010513 [Gonioctena quinquepunctata]|nr:hypothetical protein JTB14_010513 [Gonioctena quinquepunctata]
MHKRCGLISFLFVIERNAWSFVNLENLGDGEVDALLAEIPSDGESIDEFGDEHEEDFVAPMVLDDYANMEEITVTSMDTEDSMNGFSVVPIQNYSSDPVDDEDDIPLSHFVPIDKFIWKKPSTITNTGNEAIFSEIVGPTNIPDNIESPIEIFGCR